MKWKKFTIHTTTEAEDLISMMLMELGAEGVQIEDNVPLSEADTKGMFIDILPELPPDNGSSKLSFYLHLAEDEGAGGASRDGTGVTSAADNSYAISDRLWTEAEIKDLLSNIREGLAEISKYVNVGRWRIEEGITGDTDWRDNWKRFFKPVRTDGFLIMPSWEKVPEELSLEIENGSLKLISINPGTAFGTGSHETTRLCLDMISKYVKSGESVLDIGTGSGILAIAALKCGAVMASATELDPQCESSIIDNTALNGVSDEYFKLFIGNIIDDDNIRAGVHQASSCQGLYDTVTANILAPVICTLAGPGMADSFTKEGGIFITSGIIDDKLDDVLGAFAANPSWEVLEVSTMGEWCSVVAKHLRMQQPYGMDCADSSD